MGNRHEPMRNAVLRFARQGPSQERVRLGIAFQVQERLARREVRPGILRVRRDPFPRRIQRPIPLSARGKPRYQQPEIRRI
jgi:hypothetical protein